MATKLKPGGIYRKLTAMASTLFRMVVAMMCGQAWSGPVLSPAGMETIVARAVNGDVAGLAVARGLRVGRPVAVRVLDRAHLAAEREAAARAARSPQVVAAEARMLGLMGLSGKRAEGGARAPAEEAIDVTGFYDPGSKRIYVGNWVPFETDRAARLKDAAEAVLDRRFGLAARPSPRGPPPSREAIDGNGDALWARMAVFEGDATVQTLERMAPDGAMTPTRALAGEMEDVRAAIENDDRGSARLELARRLFVVLDGTAFVARVRARAPWSAVNDLWEHPPASTEQILHPDKYERRQPPDDVGARLPNRMGAGASTGEAVYSDTLGELGVRAFLQRAVGRYRAERAAAGWGGDRVRLIRGPESGDGVAAEFVVWATTWDSALDAQDFAEQADIALGSLAGAPLSEVTRPGRRHVRGGPRDARRWRAVDAGGRTYAVEWREAAVVVLIGSPSTAERSLPSLVAAATARRPVWARVR